jgi:hypothetical protein
MNRYTSLISGSVEQHDTQKTWTDKALCRKHINNGHDHKWFFDTSQPGALFIILPSA